jgi:acetoin utilization protein AcuB
MKIRDFMKTDLVTVDINTPILEAQEIMRKHNIKRLPVMKKDKFIGFVTKHMLLEAAPSSATTLSVYELNYIISKMKVGEVMIKDPKTLTPDMPVEASIWLGRKHGIGAFPVVDDGNLVGIITESDMAGILSEVLGLESEGVRITLEGLGEHLGELRDLIGILDDHKTVLLSIMSVPRKGRGDWVLVMRVKGSRIEELVKDLEGRGYRVTDVN